MSTGDEGLYVLSTHAERVLIERGIKRDWVERTLAEPDETRPDARDKSLVHHLRVIPEHGNRVLRIVVNETVDPRRIVTIFFDRRERRSI